MEALLGIGLALLLSKVFEGLVKLLGFPGLLGPLLAGLLLGHVIDVHVVMPLATLGGLILIFFAGAEELGSVEFGSSNFKLTVATLLPPLITTVLLFPSTSGLKLAIIASIPGVGVLAKLIRERPYLEVTDLMFGLALAEGIGIIIYTGFGGAYLKSF